jgi:hypothetical protein
VAELVAIGIYEQRRQTAMQETVGARAPRPQLTRAEQAFGGVLMPEYPEIPETESMRPRPVWARWLRRQGIAEPNGLPLSPPTDEEKHDAILVLSDAHGSFPGGIGDGLHVEAQRIMDEASA